MNYLFWTSVALLIFIYLGYPVLVAVLSKLFGKPVQTAKSSEQPLLTVIIPAFNEKDVIEQTIRNKFDLDYPREKVEIIVVSDESTDGTDDIVQTLAAEFPGKIKLIQQIPRQGKTAGVNKAVLEANGDILVFSDANSIYDKEAFQHLVSYFNDPDVGYVTGQLLYQTKTDNGVSLGCSAYMQYENFLRKYESRIGSVVGVDGGVDAMRKAAFTQLSPDQLPDFVQPLSTVEKNYRVIYAPEAIMVEDALTDSSKELKMRIRVSLRAFWALWDKKRLFNPFKYGLFSAQLFCHKLLRYLAFVPQIIAFVSNILLLNQGVEYQILFAAQVVFYGASVFGAWLTANDKKVPKLIYFPYYLNLLNYACLLAFWQFVQGNKIVIWKPREG